MMLKQINGTVENMMTDSYKFLTGSKRFSVRLKDEKYEVYDNFDKKFLGFSYQSEWREEVEGSADMLNRGLLVI